MLIPAFCGYSLHFLACWCVIMSLMELWTFRLQCNIPQQNEQSFHKSGLQAVNPNEPDKVACFVVCHKKRTYDHFFNSACSQNIPSASSIFPEANFSTINTWQRQLLPQFFFLAPLLGICTIIKCSIFTAWKFVRPDFHCSDAPGEVTARCCQSSSDFEQRLRLLQTNPFSRVSQRLERKSFVIAFKQEQILADPPKGEKVPHALVFARFAKKKTSKTAKTCSAEDLRTPAKCNNLFRLMDVEWLSRDFVTIRFTWFGSFLYLNKACLWNVKRSACFYFGEAKPWLKHYVWVLKSNWM